MYTALESCIHFLSINNTKANFEVPNRDCKASLKERESETYDILWRKHKPIRTESQNTAINSRLGTISFRFHIFILFLRPNQLLHTFSSTMLRSFSSPFLTPDDFSVPCVSNTENATSRILLKYLNDSLLTDVTLFTTLIATPAWRRILSRGKRQ